MTERTGELQRDLHPEGTYSHFKEDMTPAPWRRPMGCTLRDTKLSFSLVMSIYIPKGKSQGSLPLGSREIYLREGDKVSLCVSGGKEGQLPLSHTDS